MILTYQELITLPTFEERFSYLKLNGLVGSETFGFDRWMNQKFYRSKEWKDIRNYVIARDEGCDLAIPDREIQIREIIHHMNPISVDDIKYSTEYLLNPDFLITTTKQTHDAIHYGDESLLIKSQPIIRTRNDTIPWK